MTEQTRTAVLGTPRKFQLVGCPLPSAGPGTVVVQVAATAVCHTDLAPAVELVASGKVDVGGFVTATYPLARTAEAFEEYERNS